MSTENGAPAAVRDGAELRPIECDADPRHDGYWYEHDDEVYYPPGCPTCVQIDLMNAHSGCAHSHHGRWRSWKITARAASWLYVLGIISGSRWQMGGGCTGCVHFYWRSKRPYVFGLSRDTWRCLLRYRHTPGAPVAFGMCSKCLPCPDCGDKTGRCAVTCASGDEASS